MLFDLVAVVLLLSPVAILAWALYVVCTEGGPALGRKMRRVGRLTRLGLKVVWVIIKPIGIGLLTLINFFAQRTAEAAEDFSLDGTADWLEPTTYDAYGREVGKETGLPVHSKDRLPTSL